MSWDTYITKLLSNPDLEDAAIVGHEGSVWAAHPDGWLKGITQPEVKVLLGDRAHIFATGVTLGGKKCTVLRDQLNDDPYTLDLKMKITDGNPDPLFITVGKSQKALIIARGKKDGYGGNVNPAVFNILTYLRKLNF